MQHSSLGPSSAHRWANCSGSVEAEVQFYARNSWYQDGSAASEEGTRCHDLGEKLLLGKMHDVEPVDDWRLAPNTYDHDMIVNAWGYYDWVMREYDPKDPHQYLLTESTMQMEGVSATSFGTVDSAVINVKKKHAFVNDLKYGYKKVEALNNEQGAMYAMAVRDMVKDMLGVELESYTIRIYQPRVDSDTPNEWTITNDELTELETWLNKQAERTKTHPHEFNPGEKQCFWCKAAIDGGCEAKNAYESEMFGDMFEDITTATDGEMDEVKSKLGAVDIGNLMDRFESHERWIKRIREFAYAKAMNGQQIEGYKLVAKRGANSWVDEDLVVEHLGDKAYKPPAPPSLVSMSAAKKLLGKKQWDASGLDKNLSYKPGAPKLVSEDSPGEPINPEDGLAEMFDG